MTCFRTVPIDLEKPDLAVELIWDAMDLSGGGPTLSMSSRDGGAGASRNDNVHSHITSTIAKTSRA